MNELQALFVTFSTFWGAWGIWVCVSVLKRIETKLSPQESQP